jgi:hypothetical protein
MLKLSVGALAACPFTAFAETGRDPVRQVYSGIAGSPLQNGRPVFDAVPG